MKKKLIVVDTLSEYFENYLIQVRGFSVNTVSSYKDTFKLLYEYLYTEKGLKPHQVTFQDLENGTVEQFLLWLEHNRHCSVSTRNQRRAAISSFSKYALRHYFSHSIKFSNEVSSIENKRAEKPTISYFTTEEISILLSLPSGSSDTELRNQAILSFLYGSGARAQELCDLRVNDIRFDKKTTVRLLGKGNKRRVIVLPTPCADLLKEHIRRNDLENVDCGEHHVFSSHTHEHMSISCVEAIVAKYIKIAKDLYPNLFKEKRYSPHSFRHSIAVHMLEANVPLPVIKVFLGHENIQTTMIYATVSDALKDRYLKNRDFMKTLTIQEKDDSTRPYSIKEDLPFL